MYRVLCTMTIGDNNLTTSVMWEGDSIEELSKIYPPSEIYGADPLDAFGCSDFCRSYNFEWLDGDQWVAVEDPRVRTTPFTAYEEAIDAENRRLYPGDYIDDTDDDYECDAGCHDYDYDDMCSDCSEPWHYGSCDLEKIDLSQLKVVDARDDCTVYRYPDDDRTFIVVRGEVRVAVDSSEYKRDARPLHWLREAAL